MMALHKDTAGTTSLVLSVPAYWEQAKAELMKRDRIMNRLIPQFGDLHLVGHGDPFTTLARSVVGQQVSTKAADVAWNKLLTVCSIFARHNMKA